MSYERQRETALRVITRAGTVGVLSRTVIVPDPVDAWKSTQQIYTQSVKFVSFPDDGVTFVNHNIQGDVSILTMVSEKPLEINVGDTVTSASGRAFTVKSAKPLDPDLTGAILWAVLVQ